MSKRTLLRFGLAGTLLLVAAAAGVVWFLASSRFEELAKARILTEIERQTGGRPSIEGFQWRFDERKFVLTGVVVRGRELAADKPFARFPRIEIGLGYRTLLERKVYLWELALSEPEFHIRIDERGRSNVPVPAPREREPARFEISIDDFQIRGGAAFVNEDRVNMDFAISDFSGAFSYRSTTGILTSHLQYRNGEMRRPGRPVIPYGLSADFDFTRGSLLFHKVVVTSGKSGAILQGRIDQFLRGSNGKFEYTGNVDLPFLRYFFEKDEFAGAVGVRGRLEFGGGKFMTNGSAANGAGEYNGWTFDNLQSLYLYEFPARTATFSDLQMNAAGGRLRGAVVATPLPGRTRTTVNLQYRDIDTPALARLYPWDARYRILSRATGSISGWFGSAFREYEFDADTALSARGEVRATAPGEGANLPVAGELRVNLTPQQATIHSADLHYNSTTIRGNGIASEENSELHLEVNSTDLADLAFLNSDANGAGTFRGTLLGALRDPELEGDFELKDFIRGGLRLQRARGRVRLQPQSITLTGARIEQGRSELVVNGTVSRDYATLDLRLESPRIFGEEVEPFVGRKLRGAFSGSARLTSIDPIRVEGELRGDGVSVEDRLVGDIRGQVRFFDPELTVERASLRQNGSTLTGSARFNRETEEIRMAAIAAGLDLLALHGAGVPDSILGTVDRGSIEVTGTRSRPVIRGQAQAHDVEIRGEKFKSVSLGANSSGSVVNATAEADGRIRLTVQFDTAKDGYPFESAVSFTNYAPGPMVEVLGGNVGMNGSVQLAGRLADLATLTGTGRIDSLEARLAERSLKTKAPFNVRIDSSGVSVLGASLVSAGTETVVRGRVAFSEESPLELDLSGTADLGLLAEVYPGWNVSGLARIEGRVRGSTKAPKLTGFATLVNSSFAHRSAVLSLSSVNGSLFFDEQRITVNNMEGRVGGGSVRLQGALLLDGTRLAAMNVIANCQDVRVRHPEGLRTVLGGALVIRGSGDDPRLEGNLRIQSLSYREPFDRFLALFSTRAGPEAPGGNPLGAIKLAVHLEGNRNITIENAMVTAEVQVSLDVNGTFDNPSLTGHVEAAAGSVLLQGTRYRIVRGNVDFVNPLRIEPVVDIQAETELRNYLVTVNVSGRTETLRLGLRSDPPLPQIEIVNLMAGGKTREEIVRERTEAGGGGTPLPTSEQLFTTSAASILFDQLQSSVGSRVERLFGLDRIRIDPFLVGAENDPGARITVREQVTRALSITYSTDTSSNRQQIIQLEYFLSNTTSVIASRDETGALGLDIKFRKRVR